MPTDLITWVANNLSAPVIIVGLAWALLKDKPLLVLGRDHRDLQTEKDKLEASRDRYLNLLLKVNDQANKNAHITEEALNVAKATTGGGGKGSRTAQARNRVDDANTAD